MVAPRGLRKLAASVAQSADLARHTIVRKGAFFFRAKDPYAQR